MKRSISILYGLSVLICCSSFLTGCASIPIDTSGAKKLYRRIPYTVEGSYRVVDIFYATSRKVDEGKDSHLFFHPQIAEGVTYGTLAVGIDPRVKIGKMLPEHLKKEEIVEVEEACKLDEDVFMKQLSDAVAASPHNSLLVLVFGFKDNFEATAIKAGYFAYLADINTPVLLFDWPGDQPFSFSGYKKAQSLAAASGPYLGEVLTKVIRDVEPKRLWLKSSSLGCQVVCDAFDYMYKNKDLADSETEIEHVILAAPDVGEDEFDLQFKDELAAFSKKLTTYVSSNDEALLMSGLIDGERKLGRQRSSAEEQEQSEEAKDLLYLKSLDPDRIAVVDVTPINKASYRHGYYLESPEFYDDFYMRLFDKQPQVNRRLYLLKTEDNTDYWVLQGGE